MLASELESLLAGLPRVRQAILPTPLQDCPRLSGALGGPRIMFKRDDLSGLAFGGNKSRGLEFILGRASELRSDVLITYSQARAPSNHCRLTAAAAVRASLGCRIVLGGSGFSSSNVNAFLCQLAGAELQFVSPDEPEELRAACRQVCSQLRAQGHRPFLVDLDYFYGGYGAVGYVECALELHGQLRTIGASADYLYTCSQGGTQAGLVLAKKLLEEQYEVVGIASRPPLPNLAQSVAKWSEEAARLLDIRVKVEKTEVVNCADFAGPDRYTAGSDCLRAIELVARTEGIVLDPVYTGKAMAGMINHIRSGKIGKTDTAVFVHTGGGPTILDHVDAAWSHNISVPH